MKKSLSDIRHVALDLDGTLYSGGTLFEATLPFLNRLGELEIGYSFLTNNCSRSIDDYVGHFHELGLPATREQIYTSGQATIEYLQARHPDARRLFVLGSSSLQREFERAGFSIAADDPRDEPDAVIVSIDLDLHYDRLCRAAYWIKSGKLFVATHPDRVCPTDQPTVLVDCGAVTACLREATGLAPAKVVGKPDPAMLSGILQRHNLPPQNLAMIGDRLYTDMEMARQAGAISILVLSGETKRADLCNSSFQPDFIFTSVAEIGAALEDARCRPVLK